MITTFVKPMLVDSFLPLVKPLLEKAIILNHGEFSWEDVKGGLLDEGYQLFVGYDRDDLKVAVVTEVAIYPNYSNLRVVLMGGLEMDQWSDNMSQLIDSFGKHVGCKYIEVYGRKGWVRYLDKYGYKESSVKLIKEL